MNNAKFGRLNSLFWDPNTSAIDAFTCNWNGDSNWLLVVPPVNLVSKCIYHLVTCKAIGTLVVPKWPSSAFWPLLFKKKLEYVWFVRDVLEFHANDRILVAGNNKNSMFANGTFKGLLLAIDLVFKSRNSFSLRKKNVCLSYTRTREIVSTDLAEFGCSINDFGLQSCRAGRATAAAQNDISGRLFKMHGRWKSDRAKDGYMLENLQKRLSVSKNLGI
ncbi:unnamed protein product [Mytilus coruscus]|uniref:Uncharacterized protein n=1 Tax=Mytilus coruscus TaxID=42192 RepID=A0A6J8BZY5_MYTCO|nr:unnamed protein product [Mytilus coruscus]